MDKQAEPGMQPLHDRVQNRIRETICKACIYERADGGCSLSGQRECPILGRLPKIIDIIRTTHDSDIGPYVERLREVICKDCEMQDPAGTCALREHAECALDDYFVLIVDLVEQELAAERSCIRHPRIADP